MENTTDIIEIDEIIKYFKTLKEKAKIQSLKVYRPPKQGFGEFDNKLCVVMEDTIKIEYIIPIDFNFSKKSLQNEDL